jgi:hypothetical protein
MPTYNVEGCTILGNEILKAYHSPSFASIFFKLERAPTLPHSLKVKAFAANSSNEPLPNGNIEIFNYNKRDVRLNNEWIERPLKITKMMLDNVTHANAKKINYIKLRSKKYHHHEPGNTDHDKDFIGYKVKLDFE